MADISEGRMNLAAVKRVDPYIKNIRDTAKHVALYTFSTNKGEWEKTEIEGALFVYRRSGEPYNGMLIMNRLNTNNLIEPITKDLDLQVQEPFLLYKNKQSKIFGIWFYEKDECIRISALLESIVKDSEIKKTPKSSEKMVPKKNGSVDIFGMLSRAQEDFNMNKVPGQTIQENKPHPPQGPDVTSQSVMDFFAKAKGQVQKENATQQPGIFLPQRIVAAIGLPHESGETQLKPFLQRLMSNPAHSVEHIEKQQRAVTPQGDSVNRSNQTKPLYSPNPHPFQLSSEVLETTVQSSLNLLPMQSTEPSPKAAPIDLSNKMSFIHIAPSSVNTSLTGKSETKGGISPSDSKVTTVFTFGQKSVDQSRKPLLKTPAMFTSSAKKEMKQTPNTSTATGKNQRNQQKSTPDVAPSKPEPLTKNQLVQAFNYLLKNDPDFMNKLHEAYVNSLTELIP